MITYQQEFMSHIPREEYSELIERHWEEIALNKDKVKLDPDYEKYEQLETLDMIRVFTVRSSGVLVGYFSVFVFPHIHYKSTTFAQNDVLYISPEFRKGFTAVRLIKFAQECLTEDGVEVLQINTKAHKDFSKLLERMGYSINDKVYGKYLG